MTELKFHLDRSILICALRDTVFRYFTDSTRWADWWGKGSTIDPRTGGAVKIVFPNGIRASGEVLEIEEGHRIVFTYGFDSGKPIPPGSSRVTIVVKDHPEGTHLTLHHELADQTVRDEHVQGWRFQLAVFANVASRNQHHDVQNTIDKYFEMWNLMDAVERKKVMEELMDSDCKFQDQYSCNSGLDDMNAHISAGKIFMPGLTIAREGEVSQCQGSVLSNWIARKSDGSQIGKGVNVFTLTPAGRIKKIVGFWK